MSKQKSIHCKILKNVFIVLKCCHFFITQSWNMWDLWKMLQLSGIKSWISGCFELHQHKKLKHKYDTTVYHWDYSFFFKFWILFYFFIQQVLISHQFYTHQCIHVNPTRPIYHPTMATPPATFPPWCPYVCSLHPCLSFCPGNWFICTIFLGSTYMC